MTHPTDLIDRYIAAWNETDPDRRQTLIADVWTENATYLDPKLNGEGRGGINTMIATVQQHFPGHLFRRTSEVDSHNNRVRFSWELGAAQGEPIVEGIDFGILADGRLQSVTGFFTKVAAQPAAA